MSLNLRKLGIRTLSALVFVALLLGSVTWNYYSFTIFFFVVAMAGLHEFHQLMRHMHIKPYALLGFISAVPVYFSFFAFASAAIKYFLPVIPLLYLTAALFDREENALQKAFYGISGLAYCVLPFSLLHELVYNHGPTGFFYLPWNLTGIIFLIWCNDTFSYLGGSIYGRRKMIVSVSPGKTWEGSFTGLVFTFGLSVILANYGDSTMKNFWLIAGAVVPLLAVMGDLAQSNLKRKAGLKDSGNILPGHGGVLDRFDSLLFVGPFAVAILNLIAR